MRQVDALTRRATLVNAGFMTSAPPLCAADDSARQQADLSSVPAARPSCTSSESNQRLAPVHAEDHFLAGRLVGVSFSGPDTVSL